MMEQSTQTNNYERPKKERVDQKELVYSLVKKTKKEQGWDVGCIILQILKKRGGEHDYNIKQNKYCLKCFALHLFLILI